MHPKKYKDMMSWLTRNKSTNPKDHITDTLNKFEDTPNVKSKPDILRNMLIEEMKTRDLDSDEIRYLMDTKDRTELPKATLKQTAFIKNKVGAKPFKKMPREIKFDPTRPDGSRRKFLDSRKINNLNFKSKISLKQGLVKTYQDFTRA